MRSATPAEVEALLARSAAEFVAQLAASSGMSLEAAERETAGQHERLLPDGPTTEGMVFLVAEIDGRVAGAVWLALRSPNGRDLAWVFDLHVEPDRRGRGVARRLMHAAQDSARERGATAIGLNVFGDNHVARGLYDSLGYTVTAQQMRLPLDR